MGANSSTQNDPHYSAQQGFIREGSLRSRLIPLYQSLVIRLQVLETVTAGHDEKLKKQISRILSKTALSLKDDRKADIAESQIAEAKALMQQWEQVFEERRSLLVFMVEKMVSLAEKGFLSVKTERATGFSSEDQSQYIAGLIGKARKELDENNAASAMSMARQAIDALIDDRQMVLSRAKNGLIGADYRDKLIEVLGSPATRVHHREFEFDDVKGISQTAARQGVFVVKLAVIACASDLGRILAPLVGVTDILSKENLSSQHGLSLYRISIHQKCTMYIAVMPIERLVSQFDKEGKLCFSTADILDQFGAALVCVKDTSAINEDEKTAIATTLLRLPEQAVRVTRNRIGIREEMISLLKSL